MTRVLVVDDKEESRHLLLTLLTGQGCDVDEARHGAEALVKARVAPPDLVISDLLMPVMDGYTLLRHWKTDERLRQVPFVVYTATSTEPKDEQLALDLGADAFIVKPADPEPFMARIRETVAGGLPERMPARQAIGDEGALLKVYNEILIRKLEERELRLAQANRDLAAHEERLLMAVKAGKVGLWDWDLRTNQVYFSPEWKSQIGYDDAEISSEFGEWQRRVHPEDLDRALQAVRDYLAGTEPDYEAEFRLRHKDGSYRHILARASEVRGPDGTRIRLIGSHVDMTERTELQARLQQAQKMESVGRLAGGIAHDFNNLLTVINGTAGLALADLGADDPLREDFEEIRRAGARAAALTRQLLAFSRKQIMKPAVLNLNTVVIGLRDMLRRLIGEDIKVVIAPADDLGQVGVDPGQIEQVILNLAVNSRDAMPNGGTLTIEMRNVELDNAYCAGRASVQPGPYVMLAISDTGVGMDEAIRAHMFEPFFTTKDRAKGTGLGLATVYGFVEQSGGSIWVDSKPGVGTTFKIYLPRITAVTKKADAVGAVSTVPGTETVLVVEDEAVVQRLVKRTLESAGYTVLTASEGDEALRVLEQHEGVVHLLLTDVVMPGMNGRELAARVAKLRPTMKIIYTSGYTDDAVVRHGVLEDGIHFVGKPHTRAELTRKVREVLDS